MCARKNPICAARKECSATDSLFGIPKSCHPERFTSRSCRISKIKLLISASLILFIFSFYHYFLSYSQIKIHKIRIFNDGITYQITLPLAAGSLFPRDRVIDESFWNSNDLFVGLAEVLMEKDRHELIDRGSAVRHHIGSLRIDRLSKNNEFGRD